MQFVRGDTFSFKFLIKLKNGEKIKKNDIDTIFITTKRHATRTSEIAFQKTLKDIELDTDGYCHVIFEPKDTENLSYGSYFFDVEITLKNGYRKTKLFQFSLTEETTTHESGDTNGT